MMSLKIKANEREKIFRLREKGETYEQIAEKVGRHKGTVRRVCSESGVIVSPPTFEKKCPRCGGKHEAQRGVVYCDKCRSAITEMERGSI